MATNGYDRYNSLSVRDTFTLAHSLPLTAGVELGNIRLGLQYPLIFKTGKGREAKIKGNPSLSLAYAF
jgi:hypothetical protein